MDVGEGNGADCEFGVVEGCFGDSKMEHNFLTFPLNEFPAETTEPNEELYRLLTEPLRWNAGELERLYNGLFAAAATADDDEELIVIDRLKTDDGLVLVLFWGFFPACPGP